MTRVLRFSLRTLRRDGRSPELRLLAAALLLAMASVGAVGLLAERFSAALSHQSASLLAADLVVSRDAPVPKAWREAARRKGLRSAETAEFRSVVSAAHDGFLLAEVKAVSRAYPLRGVLQVASRSGAAAAPTAQGPPRGEVWVEPELLQRLALRVGDPLVLGRSTLRIGALLREEPDRGGQLFSIGPRVMIAAADLPATGLVQTGSTVEYRLLLAGAPAAVGAFRGWLEGRLGPADRVLGVREARPELQTPLQRAERFLKLAALSSVLLAAVVIGMAAAGYARRRIGDGAVMRCLGAPASLVLGTYLLQLLWIWLLVLPLALLAAWAAQAALAGLFQALVAERLPAAGAGPLLTAGATGALLLAGLAVPPLTVLRRAPPQRVLRAEAVPAPVGRLTLYASGATALTALLMWQLGEPRLVLYLAGGAVLALLVLGATALALLALLRPLRQRGGMLWRFGFGNVVRRPAASVAQVLALGLGITVLLLLALVRGDLLDAWRDQLPAGTPNQFVINIQPAQVGPVQRFLADAGVRAPVLHPMVRGRLEAISGRPVAPADYQDPRAKRLVRREFNLSWAAQPAPGNRIVAGHWWTPEEQGAAVLSVEEGIAERLGIGLGDTLRFRIADRTLSARVASLRKVDWGSFRANFFVLAPPGLLQGYPVSYITSFYLPVAKRPALDDLVGRFPNLTVIDVGALIARVRGIMDQVGQGIQAVFGFTLLAGALVLYASVQASREARLREAALLRTFGASRRLVLGALAVEFLSLGALAGAAAATLATAIGWVLAARVFDLAFVPDPRVWAWGILSGAVGAAAAGLLGARSVVRRPPGEILRELG